MAKQKIRLKKTYYKIIEGKNNVKTIYSIELTRKEIADIIHKDYDYATFYEMTDFFKEIDKEQFDVVSPLFLDTSFPSFYDKDDLILYVEYLNNIDNTIIKKATLEEVTINISNYSMFITLSMNDTYTIDITIPEIDNIIRELYDTYSYASMYQILYDFCHDENYDINTIGVNSIFVKFPTFFNKNELKLFIDYINLLLNDTSDYSKNHTIEVNDIEYNIIEENINNKTTWSLVDVGKNNYEEILINTNYDTIDNLYSSYAHYTGIELPIKNEHQMSDFISFATSLTKNKLLVIDDYYDVIHTDSDEYTINISKFDYNRLKNMLPVSKTIGDVVRNYFENTKSDVNPEYIDYQGITSNDNFPRFCKQHYLEGVIDELNKISSISPTHNKDIIKLFGKEYIIHEDDYQPKGYRIDVDTNVLQKTMFEYSDISLLEHYSNFKMRLPYYHKTTGIFNYSIKEALINFIYYLNNLQKKTSREINHTDDYLKLLHDTYKIHRDDTGFYYVKLSHDIIHIITKTLNKSLSDLLAIYGHNNNSMITYVEGHMAFENKKELRNFYNFVITSINKLTFEMYGVHHNWEYFEKKYMLQLYDKDTFIKTINKYYSEINSIFDLQMSYIKITGDNTNINNFKTHRDILVFNNLSDISIFCNFVKQEFPINKKSNKEKLMIVGEITKSLPIFINIEILSSEKLLIV